MSNRPAPRMCSHCQAARAVLKRPKNLEQLCRECFYKAFEDEVHQTITSEGLFTRGERVAVAASGGKDSTVLAHTLTTLNKRYDYGLDLFLLSIDEGITGYRDDSLETVKRNEATYGIPLLVVSYQQLYGWTMDEIVGQIGTRNNCTFCGVFRRQALDRGAVIAKANKVATGHNADDVAETVLLNLLRGDVARLSRCASAITGGDEVGGLTRVKPFKYSYEKEIVMYAYFKRLDYFSTECLYAPFAARGFARDFVKDLEAARPTAVLDLIRSAENFRFPSQQKPPAADGAGSCNGSSTSSSGSARQAGPTARQCERCGYISSQRVCKACVMLEGLNKGRPGGLAPTIARTHADFEHQRQPPIATPEPSTATAAPSTNSATPTPSSASPGASTGAQHASSQAACTGAQPTPGVGVTACSCTRSQPSHSNPSVQSPPSSSSTAVNAPASAAAAEDSCPPGGSLASSLQSLGGAAPAAAYPAHMRSAAQSAPPHPASSATGGGQVGDPQQSLSGEGQLEGSSLHKLANGVHSNGSHTLHPSSSAASDSSASTRQGTGSIGRAKKVVIEYDS